MTRILADALRERGYLHPSITPRPEIEHDPGARDAGLHHRSGCADDDRHRGGGRRRRPSAPRSSSRLGLSPGAPYQREALNARIERYIEDRRKPRLLRSEDCPGRSRSSEDDRVANMTRDGHAGAARPRRVHRRSAAVRPAAPSWCRSSGKARSTRICSRTRATGSRSTCARRAIAMPTAPHTRETVNGELVITFAVKRGQQFARRDVRDLRQRVGAAGRVRAGAAACATASRSRPRRLDADVQMIEDLYHRRGFASAKVQSAVEVVTPTPPPAQVPVAVRAGHHRRRADDGATR